MDWKDIAEIIGKAAPIAGGLLGGPAGAAVGSLVASVLGVSSTPDAVSQAVKNNPDAALKLKEMELDYAFELNKLALESERMKIADIQSARSADVAKTQATGKRDYNLYALSWCLFVGFFTLVAILIFYKVPQDSSGVIFMLFGTLSAGFGSVVTYFFGSSKSSADKTDLLAKAEPIK